MQKCLTILHTYICMYISSNSQLFTIIKDLFTTHSVLLDDLLPSTHAYLTVSSLLVWRYIALFLWGPE